VAELHNRISAFSFDRPGYDGVTQPGGVAHSAQATIRRMNAKGIKRATIAGLSFGGAVAAWIAAHHPDRVSSLVLISAAANRAAINRLDRVLAAPLVGPVLSGAMLLGASLMTHSPQMRRAAVIKAFLIEQRAMLLELPLLEDSLHSIQAPTTVVIGTADTVVSPSAGHLLASQIPGAKLVEIEGGNHALTASHAQRIAELIVATAAAVAP